MANQISRQMRTRDVMFMYGKRLSIRLINTKLCMRNTWLTDMTEIDPKKLFPHTHNLSCLILKFISVMYSMCRIFVLRFSTDLAVLFACTINAINVNLPTFLMYVDITVYVPIYTNLNNIILTGVHAPTATRYSVGSQHLQFWII